MRNFLAGFSVIILFTFILLNPSDSRADLNNRKNKSGLIYYHGNPQDNKIALTFDDGPTTPYTVQILDILKSYDVKATFFVLGMNAEKYPQVLKRIILDGHSIGNHSYSHPDMFLKNTHQIEEQFQKAEDIIFKATGKKTNLIRPPYGVDNPFLFKDAKKNHYLVIRWSVTSQDWHPNRPERVTSNVVNKTKNGSIILMHDGERLKANPKRSVTVDALPQIIQQLKAKGFQFVTVDKLLGASPEK